MVQHSIFIGYRRADTEAVAGRVFDHLESRFGKGRVFKDVDSIHSGAQFRIFIPAVINQCGVFLALIGPMWLNIRDAVGSRRLDDPGDLVRIEIETALATPGLRIVPVLVAGAELPPRDQLPESLRALTDFNAAQLRHDPDFNVDIGRLTNYLETEAKLKEIKKNIETVTPHLNVATYFVDGRLAEFTPENDAQ